MSEQEQALAGGGEMGALMRARDWSQAPLGPFEGWPPSLRATIGLMLGSPGEGTTFRVRLPRRGPASSKDMKGHPS